MFQVFKTIFCNCRYFKSQWGFPLKEDLEFNDLIDLTILKIKDAGIHESIMRRYGDLEGGGHCGKRAKGSFLNFFATAFFFIVLSVGIVLSMFLFFMKVAWSKCKNRDSKEENVLSTVVW